MELPLGFLGDEGVVPPTSATPFFEASVVGRGCPAVNRCVSNFRSNTEVGIRCLAFITS